MCASYIRLCRASTSLSLLRVIYLFLRAIERVLFIRAIRNPATAYVQGMTDLVTPFFSGAQTSQNKQAKTVTKIPSYLCTSTVLIPTFTVFSSEIQSTKSLTRANDETLLDNVEADCYWCLCKVLDTVQDHFTCSQPGIQRVCHRVNEVRFSLTFQFISPHLPHS